jgi:hypothetical protein
MSKSPVQSDLQSIQSHLHARETAMKLGIIALLAFGVPATFFGPVILASLYWVAALHFGNYSWFWIFVISCLVLIPLLFRMEWKTRGEYFSDAVSSTFAAGTSPWIGFGTFGAAIQFGQSPRVPTIGLVELFLWGPRQILDAVGKFAHIRLLKFTSRQRVAQLLSQLMKVDHLTLDQLQSSGKPSTDLYSAIAYCVWYDWIGVSKDGQKIWLDSDSRQKLSR